MGASNAIFAYSTYGRILREHDRALRVLVFMALGSMDRDAEPWFQMGWEALSEFALGRPVPPKDEDPKEYAACERMVTRATGKLREVGAIRTSERARFGRWTAKHARYQLYLHAPYVPTEHEGLLAQDQPAPPDADRPVAPDGDRRVDERCGQQPPPDADCPVAPDAECPAGEQATGQSVAGHQTLSGYPQDADRPTEEVREEDEERITTTTVAGGTVEGSPDGLSLVVSNPGKSSGPANGHKQGSLLPHGLPSLLDLPAEPAQPRTAPPCGDRTCDPVTRMREVSAGHWEPCPVCHPSAAENVS